MNDGQSLAFAEALSGAFPTQATTNEINHDFDFLTSGRIAEG
jgi:hypothetical protein